MKTIFLKELRENAKWALLMLIGMAVLLGYAIHNDTLHSSYPTRQSLSTLGPLAFAVAGFALGLLQVLQDSRRGRWQFITHRPISRGRIFAGKALAGLILYPLAAGLPLAIALWWLATPGHVAAPFEWHMVLPRLAEMLSGIIWYFAGLFAGARPARWIGSRLPPVGLALFLTIAMHAVINFSTGMLIFLAAVLFLTAAAWTVFVASREYESQPILSRIIQCIAVGPGVLFACALSVLLVVTGLEWFVLRETPTSRDYQILKDGRVVIMATAAGVVQPVTDLDGHSIDLTPLGDDPFLYRSYLQPYSRLKNDLSHDQAVEWYGYESELSQSLSVGYTINVTWWYVPARHTIEAYDIGLAQYLGSIGPDGFVPASQRPSLFPEPLYTLYGSPLRSQNAGPAAGPTTAYWVDYQHRRIRTMLTASADDPIYDVGEFPILGDRLRETGDKADYVILTRSSVHVFDDQQRELFQTPMAYPSAAALMVAQTTDGQFVLWYQILDVPAKRIYREVVTYLDQHGKVLNTVELPKLDYGTVSAETFWITSLQSIGYPSGVVLIGDYLFDDAPPTPAEIACLISLSILASLATIPLCRRYLFTPRTTAVWAILNLFLGLPGIVLLLCLRNRPARVACPSCGKPRLVTQSRCSHCANPFPPPKPESIEIFESFEPAGVGG